MHVHTHTRTHALYEHIHFRAHRYKERKELLPKVFEYTDLHLKKLYGVNDAKRLRAKDKRDTLLPLLTFIEELTLRGNTAAAVQRQALQFCRKELEHPESEDDVETASSLSSEAAAGEAELSRVAETGLKGDLAAAKTEAADAKARAAAATLDAETARSEAAAAKSEAAAAKGEAAAAKLEAADATREAAVARADAVSARADKCTAAAAAVTATALQEAKTKGESNVAAEVKKNLEGTISTLNASIAALQTELTRIRTAHAKIANDAETKRVQQQEQRATHEAAMEAIANRKKIAQQTIEIAKYEEEVKKMEADAGIVPIKPVATI
jgi:hypothetical protein